MNKGASVVEVGADVMAWSGVWGEGSVVANGGGVVVIVVGSVVATFCVVGGLREGTGVGM
jgi:hypothetical protein